MSNITKAIALGLAIAVSGCAPIISFQHDATIVLEAVRPVGEQPLFAAEYESVYDVYLQGEELLQRGEGAEAENYFRLSLLKGLILQKNIDSAENDRLAGGEMQKNNQVQSPLGKGSPALGEHKSSRQNTSYKNKNQKDRLPILHTVKRGETLLLIAALPEVFNDFRLWPLLYRSNRDQVSDPRHIDAGQILRIPRNPTREEVAEARRYSTEKPF